MNKVEYKFYNKEFKQSTHIYIKCRFSNNTEKLEQIEENRKKIIRDKRHRRHKP